MPLFDRRNDLTIGSVAHTPPPSHPGSESRDMLSYEDFGGGLALPPAPIHSKPHNLAHS